MKVLDKVAIIAVVLFSTGCAQTTGYKPVIDPYADPRVQFLQQDMAQCEQIAKENSGVGKGIATDGLTGALIGGASGAIGGAFLGDPAVGAAVGGAAGGLIGMTKGGFQADETYKRVYRNCLRNRGHFPLD